MSLEIGESRHPGDDGPLSPEHSKAANEPRDSPRAPNHEQV